LNLYPIKEAARYVTVGNFASVGRLLELAGNETFREVRINFRKAGCTDKCRNQSKKALPLLEREM
jgi:hypothetical protein